jgi:hypothetical protein
MSFKVKITQCTVGMMWYNQKIGETFEVVNYYPSCFKLPIGNKVIWKTDCEIID